MLMVLVVNTVRAFILKAVVRFLRTHCDLTNNSRQRYVIIWTFSA